MSIYQRIELGFSLIEILIVFVIISVLLSIALPSYSQHIIKGKRSEAISKLIEISNRQEQFMLNYSSYSDNLKNLGMSSITTEHNNYNFNISKTSTSCPITSCYILTA